MDWSRIKSIFIISFLILNMYLMYQYFESRNANQYEVLLRTSFEERLQAEDIEYETIPKDKVYASYLSAKPKDFTINFEAEKVAADEEVTISKDGLIKRVEFKKPIKTSKNFLPSDLVNFLRTKVDHGDEYAFWEKDETNKTLVYYQNYKGYTFYKNKNGRLLFNLNDNNEIISYEQTYLKSIESITEEEETLSALKALETIFEANILRSEQRITKVEIGYYSLIQPTSQVLTPTWRFVINNDENVFVNAFEGNVLQLESEIAKLME